MYLNPRGSRGYSEAFARAVVGDWGGGDYADVMAGLDEALRRFDFLDPARLGVMGGSYGGFMTSWIVGHTDRFRAACSERAVNAMWSMYGTSDIGYWFQEAHAVGRPPWEDLHWYLERSPLSYAKDIRTPLLIVHSESDLRCPMEQAEQLYVALKKLKRDGALRPVSRTRTTSSRAPDGRATGSLGSGSCWIGSESISRQARPERHHRGRRGPLCSDPRHPGPAMKRLVLVGGGHAHLHVLADLATRRLADVDVTLVSPSQWHHYSGMVPGFLQGTYAETDLAIDLSALAGRARARVVLAAARRIDVDGRAVETAEARLPFDVLSLDVGADPAGLSVPGAAEHAVTIRPHAAGGRGAGTGRRALARPAAADPCA